jgi:hypothetical protein
MFTDPRSWTTLLYMLLMLPLGIAYLCIVVVGLAVSVQLMVWPLTYAAFDFPVILAGDGVQWLIPLWLWPLACATGALLLFVTLHVARGIGHLHGQLAKHLLVRSAA